MHLLDKLERKLGRYAVSNLMLYIVIGTIIAYILYLMNPVYLSYLYLNPDLVAKGQVWRLITFVFIPIGSALGRLPLQRFLLCRCLVCDPGLVCTSGSRCSGLSE